MAKTPQHAPEGARRADAPPPPPPPSPRSLKNPPRPDSPDIAPDPVDQKADIRNLQRWHIGVALFHLQEINPDVMHVDLLDAWSKLTNRVVLMTDALKQHQGVMPNCEFCGKNDYVTKARKGGYWCNEYGCGAFALRKE